MDKAKILRQCNEIERAVNDLYVKRQDSITSEERISLINMLGVIVTEITTPPKSNGDRIRQMTDEELAKLLDDVDINLCNFCAAQRTNTYYDCEEESCEKCVLAWLKQEAKTNDERR